MKKLLIIITILSLLLLTGCCTSNTHPKETKAKCIPYCNSKNMSYVQDDTLVCRNTIVCGCESVPLLRDKYI